MSAPGWGQQVTQSSVCPSSTWGHQWHHSEVADWTLAPKESNTECLICKSCFWGHCYQWTHPRVRCNSGAHSDQFWILTYKLTSLPTDSVLCPEGKVRICWSRYWKLNGWNPPFSHISGNIFYQKYILVDWKISNFISTQPWMISELISSHSFFCFPLFLSISSTALPPLWNHLKVTKKIKQTGNFPDLQKFWKVTEWRRELKKKITFSYKAEQMQEKEGKSSPLNI